MQFQSFIHENQDALLKNLQKCIQIPSVYREDDSGYPYGEPIQRCLEFLLELSQSMGFRTYNMDNQVGWAEYGEGEEMVAVLGHVDVVPEGEGWSVPPYEGRIVDGRIYGRGTMDDKGPTVASLYALKALKESGLPLKRRIRVIFGLNEETGSADMKYYAAHGGENPVMGFTPDGEYPVINGEKGLINEAYGIDFTQTGDLQLKELWGGTAHNIVPDHAWAEFTCSAALAGELSAMTAEKITVSPTADGIRVESFGIGAHGGTPEEGENAIGRLLLFLTRFPLEGTLGSAIRFLAEKLGMEWDGQSMGIAMADEVSGPLTMNLGTIRGSASHLEVKMNYRYPVTRTFEDCGPVVANAFAAAGFHETWANRKNRLYMPPESELVQRLMKVYAACTGDTTSKPKSIGGGTYAKMLPNVVAFGPIFPGDEVREHKPDEYMEVSRLLDNANIIAESMYALATD